MISTTKDHVDLEFSIGPKSKSFSSNNEAIKLVKPKLSEKLKAGNKFKGLDVSSEFKFILGVNIDFKIGFE